MNNVQFYSLITVGIGSLVTVILAWLNANQRTSRLETTMDARFNAVDARFNAVDARFREVDVRFSKVDAEILSVRESMSADIESLRDKMSGDMIGLRNTVYQSLIPLHERVAVIEERTK